MYVSASLIIPEPSLNLKPLDKKSIGFPLASALVLSASKDKLTGFSFVSLTESYRFQLCAASISLIMMNFG